jgi:hypothetical protein
MMTTVGMRCLALFAITALMAGCARGPVRDIADELRVQVSAFPEEIVLYRQRDGRFVSLDQPDTFALVLETGADGQPLIAFDWIEHRSYLVRVR